MGNRLRTQDVYGTSLPTKKTVSVNPSDMLIGGLIGLFQRRYKVPFQCRNTEEMADIFDVQVTPTFYGWDCAKGFFDNTRGVDAKLYVKSHVGYTGSAYDGVQATSGTLILDASNPTIRLDSAYMNIPEFSAWGNNTAYTIVPGFRFSTTCSFQGSATDNWIAVYSVAGAKIGDELKMNITGGSAVTVYKKITSIDASTGRLYFSGAIHASSYAKVGDFAGIMGFQLHLWRKSLLGVLAEVDTDLGKIYCTMAPEVTDFYVVNVFMNSKWAQVTNLNSGSGVGLDQPVAVSTAVYLTSGADGTAPTTSAHWGINNATFDSLPIRFLTNCETTDTATQLALEVYSRGRWDEPKIIYNVPSNQSKTQLITIGNNYQRADDVLGVIQEKWYQVPDPFTTSPLAPLRTIPSVGHTMGAWIRCIGTYGIHWVPATVNTPIFGIQGVVGTQFSSAEDRTDLAEAGINTTIFQTGDGYIVKSWFTPSVTKEFMFGNGILMRDYIKISIVNSLLGTHNEPNNWARIKNSASAIWNFFYRLWEAGSTGSVAAGETFGQSINDDGTYTQPTDHFFVRADLINNPQASVDSGNRNEDCWFTFPAPAGSIKIGVGLMLRS